MSKLVQIVRNINKYRENVNDINESIIPIKNVILKQKEFLSKPEWMKIKLPLNSNRIKEMKDIIRKNNLHSVCEEAFCPNLFECFNNGTVSFMILGAICTRRCPYCNVKYGRPKNLDMDEPLKLAQTILNMALNYVVITSVNRDDLHDGGAQQFANCIKEIHKKKSKTKIEILVPDFRGCTEQALEIFNVTPPDVFNHNLENVPRMYHQVRPGADYKRSLKLLERFKIMNPQVPTKSGLMLGLGETNTEIIKVMHDLLLHGVSMLTLGQYLQPTPYHLPVQRYVNPKEFNDFKDQALVMGFTHVSCGPFVRSSYHANMQIQGLEVK